jgi:hypothetical protein
MCAQDRSHTTSSRVPITAQTARRFRGRSRIGLPTPGMALLSAFAALRFGIPSGLRRAGHASAPMNTIGFLRTDRVAVVGSHACCFFPVLAHVSGPHPATYPSMLAICAR